MEKRAFIKLNIVTGVLTAAALIAWHFKLVPSEQWTPGKPTDYHAAVITAVLLALSLGGLLSMLGPRWAWLITPQAKELALAFFLGGIVAAAPFAMRGYNPDGVFVFYAAFLVPPATWAAVWHDKFDGLLRQSCSTITCFVVGSMLMPLM